MELYGLYNLKGNTKHSTYYPHSCKIKGSHSFHWDNLESNLVTLAEVPLFVQEMWGASLGWADASELNIKILQYSFTDNGFLWYENWYQTMPWFAGCIGNSHWRFIKLIKTPMYNAIAPCSSWNFESLWGFVFICNKNDE